MHYRDIFSIFFNMKVYRVFSLKSPQWGDSNDYTQYTISQYKKKIILNYSKSATKEFYSKGFKNEFETAMVNEPLVFEPLKFYCILDSTLTENNSLSKKEQNAFLQEYHLRP